MDSWWQHCTHCTVGSNAPRIYSLELVQDGVVPCYSCVNQCYIIKIVVKEKAKSTEILLR
jgi:hypothetical protein